MDKYLLKCFALSTGVLPERLWRAAYTLTDVEKEKTEEFRIRVGRPFAATIEGKTKVICYEGFPVTICKEDIDRCIELATKSSVHSYNDQIKRGFISLPYGGRMGLMGTIVEEKGAIRTMVDISSVNIRIAKQIKGMTDELYEMIEWINRPNVLIISKVGGGKTTLLRELISKISKSGVKVGLCDERFEIAGCNRGIPTFDVGVNTDIVSGGKKQDCADMLIRSMSPEYIAFDEITQQEDVDTLVKSSYMGSSIIATAHCGGIDELYRRNVYRKMMDAGIFDYIIKIRRCEKGREILLYEKGGQNGKDDRDNNDHSFVRIFRKLHIQNTEKQM